jgi:hypothetical protein
VEFTVTTQGQTLDQLVKATATDLKKANRKVGAEVSKVGLKAMRKGAPRMWGRKLAIKSEKHVTAHNCVVEFFPAPKNAGGWQIQESGRPRGAEI